MPLCWVRVASDLLDRERDVEDACVQPRTWRLGFGGCGGREKLLGRVRGVCWWGQ